MEGLGLTATDEERSQLLKDAKTIAVVGASPKPDRPSHGVAKFLIERGYDVIPVNPLWAGKEILGRPVYASLSEIPVPVDIVDVFRRAEDCLPIAEEAVQIGAKALWLQLGIINDEAMRVAAEAGLIVVQNRCPAIELGGARH
ncbi:MAG: CoA-binding protein [Thermomicrobiales bacterium]|nr:CoA-binding protein [Thermomicrobiales bacterium]